MVRESIKQRLITVAGVILLPLVLSIFFDFYYDLNDDMAIRDILSGSYCGIPDGHCIQLLYPLGFIISLFYRGTPQIPWFGLFLLVFQMLSVYMIATALTKGIQRVDKDKADKDKVTPDKGMLKTRLILFFIPVAAGLLFLREQLFLQYTFTAGMMVCASCVGLLTGKGEKGTDIPAIIMAVLAFNLRSEMMLLLCPFIILALIYDHNRNKKAIFAAIITLAFFMLISFMADNSAYSSSDWKEFRRLFDARTSIYDFYGIPDYETVRESYGEAGLSRNDHELLVNYNIDISPDINADSLEKLASYAASNSDAGVLRRLYEACYAYVYRFTHGQELIYDLLLLLAYTSVLRYAWADPKSFIKTLILFCTKSALWIFLLFRGRVPERITHPLYMAELVFLAVILKDLIDHESIRKNQIHRIRAVAGLFAIIVLCGSVMNISAVKTEFSKREEVNSEWNSLRQYFGEHKDSFYFIDVYSSVAYSEKIFADGISQREGDFRNFDLAGGWAVKSPLSAAKKAGFELTSDNAFFVYKENSVVDDPGFIRDYYGSKGQRVRIAEVCEVAPFKVCKVNRDYE